MKFDDIRAIVADTPYMEAERAHYLYNFILDNRLASCLELGFAHGVSSCYIAAALDELGEGHLTSVDLVAGLRWQHPSIEELLHRAGLARYVTVAREHSSYTWFLKKKIEEQTRDNICAPMYDFCFIDGPKNWTIDGCAFFLVDKLLNQNGWLLFDDMSWCYADDYPDSLDGIPVARMGYDERFTPHVEQIFRLLVMQHPAYANFLIQDDWWGWAQKCKQAEKTLVRATTVVPAAGPSLAERVKRKLLG